MTAFFSISSTSGAEKEENNFLIGSCISLILKSKNTIKEKEKNVFPEKWQ